MQLASDPGPLIDASFQEQFELPGNLTKVMGVSRRREQNKQDGTSCPEPPGAPPGWQNLYLQDTARFGPGTGAGCALHTEPIDSRRQCGVVHKPLLAAGLVP